MQTEYAACVKPHVSIKVEPLVMKINNADKSVRIADS